MRIFKDRRGIAPVILTSLAVLLILVPVLPGTVLSERGVSGSISGRDLASIYWPFIARDTYHRSLGETAGRGISDPVVKWSDAENSTALASVSADLSGNIDFVSGTSRNIPSIIDSNTTHIRILDGGDKSLMWTIDVREVEGRLTNRLNTAPALADTDDDGKIEVVVPITDGSQYQIALFEPNITYGQSGYSYDPDALYNDRIWLTQEGAPGRISHSSPIAHDLDGDGTEDVLVGAGSSLVAVNGVNGSLMWSLPVGPVGEVLSSPAIYPSASLRRIAVNSLSPSKQSMKTTMINFQGDHLSNVSHDLSPLIPHTHIGPGPMPSVGDVLGDSSPEIVVPYPSLANLGIVRVYDYALDEKAVIDSISGNMDSSCALGDVNGNGKMDILIHSKYYTTRSITGMYCFEITGTSPNYDQNEIWNVEAPTNGPNTVRLYSPPLVCDLNGDDDPDGIFFSNGWVYCVSSDGSLLWNLSVPDRLFQDAGIVGDLSGDDFTDIYNEGLMISQKIIDLRIDEPLEENIYLSSENPVEGSSVRINCLVKNNGNSPARNVVVQFVDIHNSKQAIVGNDTLAEVVTTAEASVDWVPEGSGDHSIQVILDPDNLIMEVDEDNNIASRNFAVQEAFSDLNVSDINFIRGDGLVTDGTSKHLVNGDPSAVMAEILNLGYKTAVNVEVWAFVNDQALHSEVIPRIERDERINVTFDWTPEGYEDGSDVFIGVYVDHPQFVSPSNQIPESNEDNNELSREIYVKSVDTGSLSYIITGYVNDTGGEMIVDGSVTITNNRTGESLSSETGSDGGYDGDLRSLASGYQDTDEVMIYVRKDDMWARSYLRVYSEDGRVEINMTMTDIPTLSIFMEPDGERDIDVEASAVVPIGFTVTNTGNIQGEVTLSADTEIIKGNTSASDWEVSFSDRSFIMNESDERSVTMNVRVPQGADPDDVTRIVVNGVISGDSDYETNITYTLTVGRSAVLFHEFKSPTVVILDPNAPGGGNSTTFQIYLNNRGNVPVDWSVEVSGDLAGISDIDPESDDLDPSSVQWVYVAVQMPVGVNMVIGSIILKSTEALVDERWDVSVSIVKPNIRAGSSLIMEPPDGNVGEEVSISAVIENDGDINITDFYCGLLVDDELITEKEVTNRILPNNEASVVFVWTPDEAGVFEIKVVLDYRDDLLETDEEDNEVSDSLEYRPDLIITSFILEPGSAKPGDDITASIEVYNQGNAPVENEFAVSLLLGSLEGAELASKSFNRDLDPQVGRSMDIVLTFTAPEESGNHTIYALITSGESLDDPSNNHNSEVLDILSPKDSINLTYIIIGIVAAAVLLIIGLLIFLVKTGRVEIFDAEPPEGPGMPEIDEEAPQPEVSVEEEPVFEMALEEPVKATQEVPMADEVIVAEVVEVEEIPVEITAEPSDIPDEADDMLSPEEIDEELIPEV
ncbi:MAG: CARDB domain-containing protein [Thermoplasmatota archaeon]